MVIYSVLLALKIILIKLTLYLPVFGTRISFSWSATIIAGWFFGPVYGSIFGLVGDILSFMLNPGVWYWPYTLQEISVGLMPGLVHSLYINYLVKKKMIFHLFVNQILILFSFIFIIICLWQGIYGTIVWNNVYTYKWISLGLVFIYFIVNECLILYMYYKKSPFLVYYLYSSLIQISLIVFWSFLLGPYIAVGYYQYINSGRIPSSFKQWGSIYYLIPRIIRESIKTPLQVLLVSTLIYSLKPLFDSVYTLANKSRF